MSTLCDVVSHASEDQTVVLIHPVIVLRMVRGCWYMHYVQNDYKVLEETHRELYV